MWKCQCQCERKTILTISSDHLKTGHTKSCGCLRKETASKTHKKFNKYDLSGTFGIGWTSNTNKAFYFDLEDYDTIKDFCWNELGNHYIAARDSDGKMVYLHRMVLNVKDGVVDHIKHNTFDNRKSILRIGTQSNNMMNGKKKRSNTSGTTGVWWSDQHNMWVAEIMVNQRKIHLGMSKDINQAIQYRQNGEEKYFADWSYFNSMSKLDNN